jgi:pimeloyl-ACP methyl ester carboxylesterase
MNKNYILPLSDGEELDITVYGIEQVSTAPCVVFTHGFKGFKDWGFFPRTAEYLAEHGFFVITFNFSHNGIARGTTEFTELDKFRLNTFSREVRELTELVRAYFDGFFGTPSDKPAGLMGHSRGGGITLLAAPGLPKVGAVVTWSSVSHFDRYTDKQKKLWRARGTFEVVNQRTKQVLLIGEQLLDDIETRKDNSLSIERAVKALGKPLLVIHGEKDESVPSAEGGEIIGWIGPGLGELMTVPDQGHTFGAVHPFAGSNPSFDSVLEHTGKHFTRHLFNMK